MGKYDDFRIKSVDFGNDKIQKKEDKNTLIEKKDEYTEADEYCDFMNAIKYSCLEKTNLAGIGEIVESTLERPVIGTQALDTCYGILFYDRKNKNGICGHAFPSQLLNVFSEMVDWLKDKDGVIEYMILPGFRNVDRKDFRGVKVLDDYMLEHIPQNIKMVPIESRRTGFRLHQNTLSYEFAFDTEGGDFITEYVFFDPVEHNPRYTGPRRRV